MYIDTSIWVRFGYFVLCMHRCVQRSAGDLNDHNGAHFIILHMVLPYNQYASY
jgi:hypothetical protein